MATIARLAQAPLQPLQGEVERGDRVGGRCFRADDGALGDAGELDAILHIGEAGVVLLDQLDVYARDVGVETIELRQLLARGLPELLRHFDVTSLDHDVHGNGPFVDLEPGTRGPGLDSLPC